MIRAWMPSNGVRSRRAMVSRSTSYSRQFSSPPVSCMYSRCLPSLAQAKNRMPRSASSVTACAAPQSTPESSAAPAGKIGATHTLSTPSRGAIQASWLPSGEICGLTRSGLPKSTSRGMSSTMPPCLSHARPCPGRGARPARTHPPEPVAPSGRRAGPRRAARPFCTRSLTGEPVGGTRVDVVVDVFLLLVFLQAGRAELTPDARLAEAAPLGLRQVGMVIVDPHRAVAQRACHPFGLARVRGPHRAGQAVAGVVAEPDRLLLGAEPLDRHHRTEHLVLHHGHVPAAAREHRRPQEEPA